MTVLAAAEDGAEDDGVAAHGDVGVGHVGEHVERGTLVTLAGSEEVAGHGVIQDALHRARHAEGAAGHRDMAVALHVGILAATVDAGEDVSSGDVDIGVFTHTALEAIEIAEDGVAAVVVLPHRDTIGIVTRSAAEHIAEEGVAVAWVVGAGVTRNAIIGHVFIDIGVVRQVPVGVGVVPALALGHQGGDDFDGVGVVGLDGIDGTGPQTVGIGGTQVFAHAYLAAADFHAAAFQHLAVLAAAPHGANNEGTAADAYLGTVDIAELGVLTASLDTIDCGVGIVDIGLGVVAHAGTEDIAQVGHHGHLVGSHLAAADADRRDAGAGSASDGFAHDDIIIVTTRHIRCRGSGEGAHRGYLATAEDGVVYISAVHDDCRAVADVGQVGIMGVASAATEHKAVVMIQVTLVAAHMTLVNLHQGAARHRGHLAAAIDGIKDGEASVGGTVVNAAFSTVGGVHPHFGFGCHSASIEDIRITLATAEHASVALHVYGIFCVEGRIART